MVKKIVFWSELISFLKTKAHLKISKLWIPAPKPRPPEKARKSRQKILHDFTKAKRWKITKKKRRISSRSTFYFLCVILSSFHDDTWKLTLVGKAFLVLEAKANLWCFEKRSWRSCQPTNQHWRQHLFSKIKVKFISNNYYVVPESIYFANLLIGSFSTPHCSKSSFLVQ